MALTPIEKAKRAAKAAATRQANATRAYEARRAQEERERDAEADERAAHDYSKWLDKAMKAANRNDESCSIHPFQGYDNDSKITDHWGSVVEGAWGERQAGISFTLLQFAYLHALGSRFEKDGFKVDYRSQYENVMDYGVVQECAMYVSGWKPKEPSRRRNW